MKILLKSILLIVLIVWPVVLGIFGVFDTNTSATFTALVLGLVGIFQDQFKSLFIRPKLQLYLKAQSPASHKTKMRFTKSDGTQGEYPTYYYRLMIENIGDVRVENIEVFLSEKHIKINDEFVKDSSFLPLNLLWSHTREVTKKSIAPDLFKYCDFGHINHPDYSQMEGGKFGNVEMFFDFEVLPNTKSFILNTGVYRFKVIVTSDNAETISKIYEIDFKNRWEDDEEKMLAENFLVKDVIK